MRLGLTSSCATLTAVSCVCTLIAELLHCVAFATRKWIVADGVSPFVSIGFHEVCFDNCIDPYCPGSDDLSVVYDGCNPFWHVNGRLNWYFQEIWNWLLPDWFKTCRILGIVNVPFIFIIFVILAICTSLAFRGRYTTDTNSERLATAVQILLLISAVLLITSSIILLYVLITIYTYGFQRGWMPLSEKNHLGWSYWVEVATTCFLIIAFLLTIAAAYTKTMWLHGDKDPRYSEDMMIGRPSPSPGPVAAPSAGSSALGAAMQSLQHKTV